MSRTNRVPTYRKHRQSGQAIVTLPDGVGGRRDILLGTHGTKQSRLEYARAIAEWEAGGRRLPQTAVTKDLTVNELILAYWKFVEGYYLKDGKPTSEQDTIRQALRFVKRLYGHTPAKEFGPLARERRRAFGHSGIHQLQTSVGMRPLLSRLSDCDVSEDGFQ
jgi:hypothetical protein